MEEDVTTDQLTREREKKEIEEEREEERKRKRERSNWQRVHSISEQD